MLTVHIGESLHLCQEFAARNQFENLSLTKASWSLTEFVWQCLGTLVAPLEVFMSGGTDVSLVL